MNGPHGTARLLAGMTGIAVLALALPAAAPAQEGGPLLKSDLVRMMTASNYTATEMAAIVRMNCVGFEPTTRDRNQLGNLPNADVVLAEVDRCMARPDRASNTAASDGEDPAEAVEEEQRPQAPPRPTRRNIDLAGMDIAAATPRAPELKRPKAASIGAAQEGTGASRGTVSSEPETPPALENWQEVSRALLDEYRPNVRQPGSVLLWLRIGPDGRVAESRVKRATGDPSMADAVLRITEVMEFTPATRDGRPVESWTELPVNLNSR